MPYVPYWFESFDSLFPWVVPAIAIGGLLAAKGCETKRVRRIAHQAYYAGMLIVAWCTLRTIVADEGCWLLHMSSMGAMMLGSTIRISESEEDSPFGGS